MRPLTVVIGTAALRTTWRRTNWRRGMPRLSAVCTCSRANSSRTAARVTRATSATDDSASATAGSVRCRTRSPNPSPSPIAGNQPSSATNTIVSSVAATNAGTAASSAVVTSTARVGDAAPQPGEQTEPDADQQDQDRRVQHELPRDPDAAGDQPRHLVTAGDRDAEVAAHGVAEPLHVAQRGTGRRGGSGRELLLLLGWQRAPVRERGERRAGCQRRGAEDHEARDQQRRDEARGTGGAPADPAQAIAGPSLKRRRAGSPRVRTSSRTMPRRR